MFVPVTKMRPHWVLLDFEKNLADRRIHAHTVFGNKVASYRDAKNELHVVDSACPHRGASLALGTVKGASIVCPFHARECGMHTHPELFYDHACLQGLVWVDLASKLITQHFMPPYFPEFLSDWKIQDASSVLHVNPVVLMEYFLENRASPDLFGGTSRLCQGGPYGKARYTYDTPEGTVVVDHEYHVPFTTSWRFVLGSKPVLVKMASILPASATAVVVHTRTARSVVAEGSAAIAAIEEKHARGDIRVVASVDPSAWSRNRLAHSDDLVQAYRQALVRFYPEVLNFCVT